MKAFLRAFGFVGIFLNVTATTSIAFAQAPGPVLVPSNFETGFMPEGFDANDQVQFVAEGYFPDSCYKAARPEIEVSLTAERIHVRPKALRYSGPCLDMIVPFHQVIEVGLLPPGNYTISVGDSAKIIGRIPVKEAVSAAPDDFLYAPVSQVYYRKSGGRHLVVMTGEFSNSCVNFKETRFTVRKNVISVQPVTELQEDGRCRNGRFPFERVAELPQLRSGRYLLHVRSLNATALNSLVNVL